MPDVKLNPELPYNRGVLADGTVVKGAQTASVTAAEFKKLQKVERQGLPVWVEADYDKGDSEDNDES